MTQVTKTREAVNRHLRSKCEACTYSVQAFGPVCRELAELMRAERKAFDRLPNTVGSHLDSAAQPLFKCGDGTVCRTEGEALKYANDIARRTGVIISVERAAQPEAAK